MSDDNKVVGLRGEPIKHKHERLDFLERMGIAFDSFFSKENDNKPPEAWVLVLGGVDQYTRISWHSDGASESSGRSAHVLAMAAVHCTREVMSPDDDDE